MNDLDHIGLIEKKKGALEGVDPAFIKALLLEAQKKSWTVLREIQAEIKAGMTEDAARQLALSIFQDYGVKKHWHRPFVRFGPGTRLTFNDSIQASYRLSEGDPFYIDLGPVWPDAEQPIEYEGDVGDTFVFGENPEAEKCAETARSLFKEAKAEWQKKKLSGQAIYVLLEKRAKELGYQLVEQVEGHRIGSFPHHKFSKERLAFLDFFPSSALWILEVQIVHPHLPFGAFFEDIL